MKFEITVNKIQKRIKFKHKKIIIFINIIDISDKTFMAIINVSIG